MFSLLCPINNSDLSNVLKSSILKKWIDLMANSFVRAWVDQLNLRQELCKIHSFTSTEMRDFLLMTSIGNQKRKRALFYESLLNEETTTFCQYHHNHHHPNLNSNWSDNTQYVRWAPIWRTMLYRLITLEFSRPFNFLDFPIIFRTSLLLRIFEKPFGQ